MKSKWFRYYIYDNRGDRTAGIINADDEEEAIKIFKKYYRGMLRAFIHWNIEEIKFEDGIKEIYYGG